MAARRGSDSAIGAPTAGRKGGGKEKIFDIDDLSPNPAQVR